MKHTYTHLSCDFLGVSQTFNIFYLIENVHLDGERVAGFLPDLELLLHLPGLGGDLQLVCNGGPTATSVHYLIHTCGHMSCDEISRLQISCLLNLVCFTLSASLLNPAKSCNGGLRPPLSTISYTPAGT